MTAQVVRQRRRETGVRLALGARPTGVLLGLMRRTLGVVALGLIAGSVAWLTAARGLRALVFGIDVHDPGTIGVLVVVLLITAATATYLPARRALFQDPVASLRDE